jgi:hypothetical protein
LSAKRKGITAMYCDVCGKPGFFFDEKPGGIVVHSNNVVCKVKYNVLNKIIDRINKCHDRQKLSHMLDMFVWAREWLK